MTKKYTILFSFLLLTIISFGQHRQDTVVNKDHYNFIDYYPNGHLKILGNYQDTLKSGHWIYYKINGDKNSCGQYKAGHKNGKWIYYKSDRKKVVLNWSDKNPPDESIEYNKEGDILIYDSVYVRPCTTIFINGFPTKSIRWM